MPPSPPDKPAASKGSPLSSHRARADSPWKSINKSGGITVQFAKFFLVLLVLYHLTGFFIIPYLLESFSPLLFAGHPDLSGNIASASFNPYNLRLEISGIEIWRGLSRTPTERPLFSCDHLLLDLEWRSLRYQALITREAQIDHFAFDLPPAEDRAGPEQVAPVATNWLFHLGGLPFYLQNLTVRDSRITLGAAGPGDSQLLEQINLTLPLLHNLPPGVSLSPEPQRLATQFSALINGQKLTLQGSPGERDRPASGPLKFDFLGLDLSNRLQFLLPRGLRCSRGKVDLAISLLLPESDDSAPLSLTLRGHLTGLELRDPGNDFLFMPKVAFDFELAPLQGIYRCRQLRLEKPQLRLTPEPDGLQSAHRFLPILRNGLPRLLSLGDKLRLDQFTVNSGTLQFAGAGPDAAPDYTNFSLNVTGVGPGRPQPGSFAFSFLDRQGQEIAGGGGLNLAAAHLGGHFFLINPPPGQLALPRAFGPGSLSVGAIPRLTGDFKLFPARTPKGPLRLEFERGELALTSLRLGGSGHWHLFLPQATITGATFGSEDRGWRFARLSGSAGELTLEQEPFLAFASPVPGPTGSDPSLLAPREIELTDSTVHLVKSNNTGLPTFSLLGVSLRGLDLWPPPGKSGRLLLNGSLPQGGRLNLEGELSLSPFRGDLALEIDGLALPVARPLLNPFLPPLLQRGTFKGQGRLRFPSLRLAGDLYLTDLSSATPSGGEAAFTCESAILKDLTLTFRPAALSARELLFSKPEIKTSRLARKQTAPAAFLFPAAGNTSASTPRLLIDTVNITDGGFLLTDRSLDPDLELRLEKVSGLMSRMDNGPGQSSPFKLQAQARLSHSPETEDWRAPASSAARLNLQGEAALFGPEITVRAGIELEKMALPSLEPWIGELLGYAPLRGWLDLSGDFTLAGQRVSAAQQLIVSDLTLGSSLSGRFNTALTMALLTDPRHRIVVDLEIEGDHQPPYFSYAEGLADTVRERLARTTVAPFSLLSAMAPSGTDLDYIAFVPGATEPAAGEGGKLRTLAAILAQRPRLGLVITAQANHLSDWAQNASRPGLNRQIPSVGGAATSISEAGKLALRRGQAVKDLLIRAGLSGERLRLAAAESDLLEEENLQERPGDRVDLGLEVYRGH